MKRAAKEALQLQHTIGQSIDNPLPWQKRNYVSSLSHKLIYISFTIDLCGDEAWLLMSPRHTRPQSDTTKLINLSSKPEECSGRGV